MGGTCSPCETMTAKEKVQAKERELQWQAESDLRTIMEFNNVKNDPARYARAKALAKQQLATLQNAAKK